MTYTIHMPHNTSEIDRIYAKGTDGIEVAFLRMDLIDDLNRTEEKMSKKVLALQEDIE